MDNYNRYSNEFDSDFVQAPTGKQKAGVFFRSLLLGFVLGLAILLIAWFFIL